MSAYAMPAPAVTPTDRLSMMLFFAVCAHLIVVLGITFVKEERPRSVANTLDVVLVQRRSESTPDEADFLGQADQEGGGASEQPERPATPLPSALVSNEPELPAVAPPAAPSTPVEAPPAPEAQADVAPPTPQAAPKPILAVENRPAPDRVAPPVRETEAETPPPEKREHTPEPPRTEVARAAPRKRPTRQRKPAPQPAPRAETAPVQTIDAAALVRRSLAMASLSAEVDQRLDAYAKRPRQKWISARTREHKYAAYMEAWRSKVERVGNLNYPDEARRRRLSGDLLLDVALKPDGSVHDIIVRRTSGHAVLDDAAVRIVRLAAPYARFPKSIREETDILHIQRTWRFLTGNRFASR